MAFRSSSVSSPWPRDELAVWSDARSSTAPLADIPQFHAAPPPGRTLMVGGQDLFVRTTGDSDHRCCTWYVHGLEGMSQNWDRLAGALRDYSTGWAPDLPGSGLSGPPRSRHSLVAEADVLAALIRRTCGHPIQLVGNSRGGIVATLLAARHPGLVQTLTLISPAVPDLRPISDRGADIRLGLVMVPGVGRLAAKMLMQVRPDQRAHSLATMCFGEPEALTTDDLLAAEREYARRAGLPWAASDTVAALQSLIRGYISVGPTTFTRAARQVKVPVLVVWGTRDRLVDARLARRTAAAFGDSRLLMLARTGHVAQMERPAQTARAMIALWEETGVLAG